MNTASIKSDWYRHDIESDARWIRTLSINEKVAIEKILDATKLTNYSNTAHQSQLDFLEVQPIFNTIFDATTNKWGFVIVKGLPAPSNTYSTEIIRNFFLEFCRHIGHPLIQSKKQEYLYDVKESSSRATNSNARGPQLTHALPLHADHGGLLGMYCLKSAKKGGYTLLGSVKTIHDEIAKIRPDLLEILYQPFYGDRRGQEPEGELPYDYNPVFSTVDDQLLCQYVGIYYREAPNKFPDIPKLSLRQLEALDLFHEISSRQNIQLEVKLEAGDAIFINNNKVLHGRTAFQNSEESLIHKRHLLRIWLSTQKIKSFPHYYGYPMPS